jgi:hypothetical protein
MKPNPTTQGGKYALIMFENGMGREYLDLRRRK